MASAHDRKQTLSARFLKLQGRRTGRVNVLTGTEVTLAGDQLVVLVGERVVLSEVVRTTHNRLMSELVQV